MSGWLLMSMSRLMKRFVRLLCTSGSAGKSKRLTVLLKSWWLIKLLLLVYCWLLELKNLVALMVTISACHGCSRLQVGFSPATNCKWCLNCCFKIWMSDPKTNFFFSPLDMLDNLHSEWCKSLSSLCILLLSSRFDKNQSESDQNPADLRTSIRRRRRRRPTVHQTQENYYCTANEWF